MKLEKATIEELKDDLEIVLRLSEQNKSIEEKYEDYGCNSLYGLRQRILQELGIRSLKK